MSALLVQPWVTIKGTTSVASITQDEEDWVDVGDEAEGVFWVDLREVTGGGGTLNLLLETSPTKDESLFQPTYPPLTISNSTFFPTTSFATSLVVRTVRTPSTVPLAKWLRWRLTASGSTSAWDATFRLRAKFLKNSSFVPTDLSGCQLWLRGDLGITFNGNNVSAWADQSGLASPNSAFQGTPLNQPTYGPTAMNGFPAIQGDGANSWMVTSNSINITTNATLFAAVQATTTPQTTNYTRIMETSNQTNYYLGCTNAGTGYKLIVNYNSTPFGSAETDGTLAETPQLVTGWYQGGSPGLGIIYLNGQVAGSDNLKFNSPGSMSQLPLYIMRSFLTTAELWKGYVGELIIYNRALSSQELIRVHRYLGARYGVSGT